MPSGPTNMSSQLIWCEHQNKEFMLTKDCKIHGPASPAYKDTGRIRCKKCNVEAVTERRRKLKRMALDYMGGCCQACGYKKSVSALQFHHLDPEEKDFGISGKGTTRSWEKIKVELDKCVLLCANCHAEVHEGLLDI